jgi:hypothetical protein
MKRELIIISILALLFVEIIDLKIRIILVVVLLAIASVIYIAKDKVIRRI